MMDADEAYFKQHGEPLFSSHMIDLSEEDKEENIAITKKYLERAAPMKQFLEMEIGITGGEEDGVNNEDVRACKPQLLIAWKSDEITGRQQLALHPT
jgi:fructose-bisphosphate aldolase class II